MALYNAYLLESNCRWQRRASQGSRQPLSKAVLMTLSMVGTDRQKCKHALHLCRHRFCKIGKICEGLLSANVQSSSQDSVEFMITSKAKVASSDALSGSFSGHRGKAPNVWGCKFVGDSAVSRTALQTYRLCRIQKSLHALTYVRQLGSVVVWAPELRNTLVHSTHDKLCTDAACLTCPDARLLHRRHAA